MSLIWSDYTNTVNIRIANPAKDCVQENINPIRNWIRTNIGGEYMDMIIRDSDNSIHYLVGFKTVENQLAFKLACVDNV